MLMVHLILPLTSVLLIISVSIASFARKMYETTTVFSLTRDLPHLLFAIHFDNWGNDTRLQVDATISLNVSPLSISTGNSVGDENIYVRELFLLLSCFIYPRCRIHTRITFMQKCRNISTCPVGKMTLWTWISVSPAYPNPLAVV